MSVTLSNCQEICNSPLNCSKAKMLYSFPRSQRFRSSKKILYISRNSAATSSTIFHQLSTATLPASAMVPNTTLQKGMLGLI